jgi:type I restriction enzyme, S subunit
LQLQQETIYSAQTGGAQPHIQPKDLSPLPVLLPIGLDEQQTIAKVLCDMEDELAALESRLAKTRDLKQGMMQELLTGRIRLV